MDSRTFERRFGLDEPRNRTDRQVELQWTQEETNGTAEMLKAFKPSCHNSPVVGHPEGNCSPIGVGGKSPSKALRGVASSPGSRGPQPGDPQDYDTWLARCQDTKDS